MVFRREKEDLPALREGRGGEVTIGSPFDLWSDMDRLFEQFRAGFDSLFWPFSRRKTLRATSTFRAAPLDVADLGDKYELKLAVPGIPKDQIDIEVTPYGVEISAEQQETKEEKGKNWLRRELGSTGVYRSVQLPEELKTEGVEAKLKDGVLTIHLPKANPRPELKPKKVEIK
ncbi:MAG: Hsp20/alpha crystallin family protein [Methanobacteriota archaeon]|nr:MAG: Hsp20/alpha crystallin family protein [Euryarchaeota archaeon]